MTLKGKKRLVARLRKRADAVVQLTSADLYRRIARRTPEQTGRLASSWTVSIGSPKGEHVVYSREGDVQRASKRNIARASKAKAGDVIYITSRQPYARAVEFGDEDHKPVGMVRLSAAEAPAAFRAIVAQAIRRGHR